MGAADRARAGPAMQEPRATEGRGAARARRPAQGRNSNPFEFLQLHAARFLLGAGARRVYRLTVADTVSRGRARVALVGLGMAVAPHAKSLQDLAERVEVAYAFSPSAERRAAFADRYGFPLCERLEVILDDPSIVAVGLLTPPNTHAELVERCARAKKHVLLEKPLEITSARAHAVVDA